jgi:hypothetical protein
MNTMGLQAGKDCDTRRQELVLTGALAAIPPETYDQSSTYAQSSQSFATNPRAQTTPGNIQPQSTRTIASARNRTGGFIKASEGDQVDYEELDPSMTIARIIWYNVDSHEVISDGNLETNFSLLARQVDLRVDGSDANSYPQVFRVLWPEVAGYTTNENITVITDTRFGENFVSKIRWFVVVKEEDNSALCL